MHHNTEVLVVRIVNRLFVVESILGELKYAVQFEFIKVSALDARPFLPVSENPTQFPASQMCIRDRVEKL